jgi:catechol 2,3-dioxygenase-like lactoylglutathione lyase family enzyme
VLDAKWFEAQTLRSEQGRHAAILPRRKLPAVAGSPVQRLDHVSLNVSDRTRSIAWYRDVLGLEQRNEPTEDAEPVFMGEFGRCIGLFQAQSAAERPYESVGLRHVAFTVDSIEEAQERLRQHGVDFRFEDHGNAHSVYLRDPDGHTLELTVYV